MMRITRELLAAAAAALATAACAHGEPAPQVAGPNGPAAAIEAAASAAPSAVRGVYEIRVRSVGQTSAAIYLNSEPDYRDQLNLSIALQPSTFANLKARFGDRPAAAFVGKRVRVEGEVKRVRVDFLVAGQPSGKFYYQTHMDVNDASKIQLVPEPDA